MKKEKVGRPTKLDEQLFRKIKELVLDGKNLTQMSEILEIPYATMRDWQYENYEGFSDKLLSYKHERMLLKADTEIEVLQSAEDERVRLQANTFVAETIGKAHYSKRSELTGKDGEKLLVVTAESASRFNVETK